MSLRRLRCAKDRVYLGWAMEGTPITVTSTSGASAMSLRRLRCAKDRVYLGWAMEGTPITGTSTSGASAMSLRRLRCAKDRVYLGWAMEGTPITGTSTSGTSAMSLRRLRCTTEQIYLEWGRQRHTHHCCPVGSPFWAAPYYVYRTARATWASPAVAMEHQGRSMQLFQRPVPIVQNPET
ncbi:hypothetical protein NDU88_000506 [Pleurodeles waltl]|uniref:Uncharacterized protein n=1 Tax=Pleurodeles waltl TaxID=8319 RepID=A0AAV7Q469_PLEWA|nr:hypothetical protein NDU88_000506 [Pleurodeles waltl]